jgi:hypothetical protein
MSIAGTTDRTEDQIGETEYISRHGDIVKALRQWRGRTCKPSEELVKNAFIDLGVKAGGELSELYEVKSGGDRQSLYEAIGQVMVHTGSNGNCKRILVLPADYSTPSDISQALARMDISLLRFQIRGDSVRILP